MSNKRHKSARVSLDIPSTETTITTSSGWGAVFRAAASVKLEELDDDFLSRTASTKKDEGLLKVAEIARLSNQKRKRDADEEENDSKVLSNDVKKENNNNNNNTNKVASPVTNDPHEKDGNDDDDDDDEVDDNNLEGMMVLHPTKPGEQVMILINRMRGRVYSALRRTESGNLIEIGELFSSKDDSIVWHSDAFQGNDNAVEEQGVPEFPFATDPDDHCESPLEAYQDIMPFLEKLGRNCRIYDPYYCNGAVKDHLRELGFRNVHNVKEDCYRVWATKQSYPEFDLFLTNPPYSGDHIPRLVQHLQSLGDTPWALLMPQWVHKKDYWHNQWNQKCFYLVPNKRYTYKPPKDFRAAKASDVHRKSSPFVSMWFLWGGTQQKTQEWMNAYHNLPSKRCNLARSKNALRDLRRKGGKKKGKK